MLLYYTKLIFNFNSFIHLEIILKKSQIMLQIRRSRGKSKIVISLHSKFSIRVNEKKCTHDSMWFIQIPDLIFHRIYKKTSQQYSISRTCFLKNDYVMVKIVWYRGASEHAKCRIHKTPVTQDYLYCKVLNTSSSKSILLLILVNITFFCVLGN